MPANYKQLLIHYESKPKEIKLYFGDPPKLVEQFVWEIPISYMFSKIEVAKRRTLHGGIVKIHRTDSALTAEMLDIDHMTRGRFRALFKIVFDKEIDQAILKKLSDAEAVRDRVAHGRRLNEAAARQCLADALDFSEELNEFVNGIAKFRPFADLRGFKGASAPLSKDTTRWVLRGMGIPGNSKEA